MSPAHDTDKEINSLASLVLPAVLERIKNDTATIEGLVGARPFPETDLRGRLLDIANKVYSYTVLAGALRGMVPIAERLVTAVGKTAIEYRLDEAFTQMFNRLWNQQYHWAGLTRRAVTSELWCRAIALDSIYKQVQAPPNAMFAETIMALCIATVTEEAKLEYANACADAEVFELSGSDNMSSVADNLCASMKRREAREDAEQVLIESRAIAEASVEGNAESAGG